MAANLPDNVSYQAYKIGGRAGGRLAEAALCIPI